MYQSGGMWKTTGEGGKLEQWESHPQRRDAEAFWGMWKAYIRKQFHQGLILEPSSFWFFFSLIINWLSNMSKQFQSILISWRSHESDGESSTYFCCYNRKNWRIYVDQMHSLTLNETSPQQLFSLMMVMTTVSKPPMTDDFVVRKQILIKLQEVMTLALIERGTFILLTNL